jgi:hypothetical protein
MNHNEGLLKRWVNVGRLLMVGKVDDRSPRFLVCSKCGSSSIQRSKRHGMLEWILKRIFIVPWHCLSCQQRFFHS